MTIPDDDDRADVGRDASRMAKDGELTLADFRGAAGTPDERRREDRVPCAAGGDEAVFTPARLVDCSPGGLGIIADAPMAAGDEFLVKLALERLVLVRYTVRHCRPCDGGGFAVGAELSGVVGTPDDAEAVSVMTAILGGGDGLRPSP